MNRTESIPTAESLEPQPARLRWLMIAFAMVATVINYLDRQTLSVVAPLLKKEFNMTDETYGLIISAFMLAYTVMNGVSGPLLDRIGTRLGYALCMFWWSTAGLLHAFARGPLSLGLFRFLLGMGEAGNWPAAVKLVSEWFPARERALASGIFNSGSALGALAAPPLVAWLVIQWGWPQAFLIVGVSGYLWLIGWWFIYFTPGHVQKEVKARPAPAWRLLKTRFLASLTIAKVFLDPVWYFYIFWIPKFLSSVHQFDLIQIGKTAWIPFLTADIGNLAGGALPQWLVRRRLRLPLARKITLTLFALLMTSAIPAVIAKEASWTIVFISIGTFGYTGFNANALSLPADVFPKNMVGSIQGLASMGAGFGGMLFSWLSGRLIDQYGYTPVFIGYGVFPIIGIAIILLFIGPLTPDPLFHGAAGQETATKKT